MTAEAIVVEALARTTEFTDEVPSTRSLMYRRISSRQQQLFSLIARTNPDYFGICAIGTLDNGGLDLSDIVDPVQMVEAITKVTVEDPGTSGLSVGDEVHIVPITDVNSAMSPRATLRNFVIDQVGIDLQDVISLMVFYSRRPLPVTDSAQEAEIPESYIELLIIDLAKHLIRKVIDLENKSAILGLLETEEAELLNQFLGHVQYYTANLESRFSGTPHSPR